MKQKQQNFKNLRSIALGIRYNDQCLRGVPLSYVITVQNDYLRSIA